jgi:hypothetical protein
VADATAVPSAEDPDVGAERKSGTNEIVAKKTTISAKKRSAYIQPALSVTSSPTDAAVLLTWRDMFSG